MTIMVYALARLRTISLTLAIHNLRRIASSIPEDHGFSRSEFS
jgi:hypothetical protein